MEIRVLKYFLAIAREGSITAAANALHLTQPTLTRQMQDLEYELKQKLFVRGKHNIILTDEGMLLKDRAEEIIEMVNKTKNEILSSGENVKGNIYIGCGETEAMQYVAEIIKKIQDVYPDIVFHIHSANADEVVEKLDKKLFDFGVLIQPVDIAKYDNITLPTTDTWGVLMRKDSPLAKYQSITLEKLKNLPLIISRQVTRKFPNNDYTKWFQGEFETFNIVATYNLIYNAALLVKSGIGYAVALDKLANTSSESELCFRPFEPKLESKLDIVWNKFQARSAVANLFLQKLQETFRNR